jgi:DNA modification methylase
MTLTLFPAEAPLEASPVKGAVSRATDLYNVHAYHTKVPSEGIEPFLLVHTEPGHTVIDPFCGSGMTGVAARRMGRRALLSDLSPAAVHIASNYTTPCDPRAYSAAVERIAEKVEHERADLYATTCHCCGGKATTAYVVWSDMRRCPNCEAEIRLWDHRAAGLRQITCPACTATFRKGSARVIGEVPVQVSLDCSACGRLAREPIAEDIQAAAIDREQIPYWYPDVPFGRDREMWRAGHEELGIQSVADFYSPRNLRALAALWDAIQIEGDSRLRRALSFTFTAIANRASRRYQWNAKRPTNVLGGTLYVSSLRYEFNVFGLWRRKVAAMRRFFESSSDPRTEAVVAQASATALPYADESVDYCFTDPPFGANIIYSDCSLLWEAWLGSLTDKRQEAVMSHSGKDLDEYALLMESSFREIHRVLKRGAAATVVFQNTDSSVWEALVAASVDAGFAIESVEVLHKSQPSFKGVKAQQDGERVAASDVVLTLRRDAPNAPLQEASDIEPVWLAVQDELRRNGTSKRQRTTGHLYAVAVAAALGAGVPAGMATFAALEGWLAMHCEPMEGGWRIKGTADVL